MTVPEVRAQYLHAFCIAARAGSVSAAARRLGLSQPAVSRNLRLLQQAHGAPLYRRLGAGIELTPAGRALLPFACAASESLTRARQFISGELQEGGAHLRIGLSHHLTTRFTGQLLQALHTGDIDAAFLLEAPGPEPGVRADVAQDNIEAALCGTERAMLLVKHDDPIGSHLHAPLTVLEGESLIVPSFASTMYRSILDALQASGVQPGKSIEVSGPAAVRSAMAWA